MYIVTSLGTQNHFTEARETIHFFKSCTTNNIRETIQLKTHCNDNAHCCGFYKKKKKLTDGENSQKNDSVCLKLYL